MTKESLAALNYKVAVEYAPNPYAEGYYAAQAQNTQNTLTVTQVSQTQAIKALRHRTQRTVCLTGAAQALELLEAQVLADWHAANDNTGKHSVSYVGTATTPNLEAIYKGWINTDFSNTGAGKHSA